MPGLHEIRTEWLDDLLPVRNLDDLAPRLARLWREVGEASAAHLAVLSSDGTRVCCGHATENSSAGRAFDVVHRPALSEAIVRELTAALDGGRDLSAARQTLIGDPRKPVAALVLFGPSGDDPFAGLTGLLRLTERLVEQGRLVDQAAAGLLAAKLESMAEFAAGAAHEINNPAGAIAGRAQLLLRHESDPEKRRQLAVVGGQAFRIRDMIGDAWFYGRPTAPAPEHVELAEAVEDVRHQLGELVEERQCRVDVEPAREPGTVWADPAQLRFVLAALLRNSLEHSPPQSTVTIGCESQHALGVDYAELTVTDPGTGLTEEQREHLFDPFYSGRQAGRGLGFGLSKAWRIVRLHHGRIEAESSAERTTLRVTWPRSPLPEATGEGECVPGSNGRG